MSKYNIVITVLMFMICVGCKKSPVQNNNNNGNNGNTGGTTYPPNTQHISVLTQHNDNSRSGLNNQEAKLTTANVNSKTFGKLFNLAVDDYVFAQPLVVGNLPISSGTHNVVFVSTVANSVYAFDADNGTQYWKKNYTVSGMRPPSANDMNSSWCSPYNDIPGSIGIIGTPVIDSVAQTIYFVARSTDGVTFVQYLHAVNITTGAEQPGSPVQITASVKGTGDGSSNGIVSFDPRRNNQRQGLVLVNGAVYISFSSHCDWNPYHGWIIGYNSKTLAQQTIYCDTPNGEAGGIWESGMGIAADAQGNLFVDTGNGTVGSPVPYTEPGNGTGEGTASTDPTDLTNRAESALKLTPAGSTLTVSSYFTPSNYLDLNINDLDYGVMGTMLIPNSNFYLTGCKDGNLYLLNKDNMGGYTITGNAVQQTIPLNVTMHCQPAYYKSSTNEFIYVWSENDQLRAFPFSRASNTLATSQVIGPGGATGPTGADLSVSSNGTLAGTGVLWATYPIGTNINSVAPGILRAFDASDITKELWNSGQTVGDEIGFYAKFCSPTVVNGHVYLATFTNQVIVYGLK